MMQFSSYFSYSYERKSISNQATRLVYFNHNGEFIFLDDIWSCANWYFTSVSRLLFLDEKMTMNFLIRNTLIYNVLIVHYSWCSCVLHLWKFLVHWYLDGVCDCGWNHWMTRLVCFWPVMFFSNFFFRDLEELHYYWHPQPLLWIPSEHLASQCLSNQQQPRTHLRK